MQEREVAVKFEPSGKAVFVLEYTRLLEAAASAGLTLDQPCGGEGTCGKCRVRFRQGACEPTQVDENAFSAEEIAQGWRLACQAVVVDPAIVEIPASSLLPAQQQILVRTGDVSPTETSPAVRKQYVELRPPERGDDAADLLRLEAAVGPLETDLEALRALPEKLREDRFRGTAVMAGGRLVDFEPGNTESECFAVAVDLGTTTLAAALLDLRSGDQLAVASRLNPQTAFGDDVLSRIEHARRTPQGLNELHEAAVEAIDEMIGQLAAEAAIRRDRVYEVIVSGNTTMQQLFCRIDTRSLGEVPFVAATSRGIRAGASRLGLNIHPRGSVFLMPVIGGFVGGDTVSGILATGLVDEPGPALLIDIGTNGEIVLWADGKLAAASTAAGPAFEGARISQGMRASTGAIDKVLVADRLLLNVIGNVAPVGLCGSALVDLAAELLRHGVLAPEGRLRAGDELPGDAPADLRKRVIALDGRPAFLLVDSPQAGADRAIRVTQRDFRELQLATGAIRAGIVLLLRRAGLAPESLDRVLVAGGFGNFIRRSSAQRIGLLPPEIERRRIRYQGNTSLAGARLAAVSTAARQRAEELARRTEHVDLSCEPDFQTAFAEAMIFPEA
ncbi:MAG: DUF4445 domain-containing protein [Pirellulales bacterium]|nr:DUF4445 domain-containing protein [Pirellulales bacterium]